MVQDLDTGRQQREEFKSLLESLSFPTITKRQEDLYDPYPTTSQWMMESQSSDRHEHNFREWLEFGNEIYWISGNAASGKSTASLGSSTCTMDRY